MDIEQQVESTLESYAQAWRLNSTRALIDFWSQEHFAYYKAEEVRNFYTQWPDVLAYWSQNEGLHDDIRLQLTAFNHIPLTDDRHMVAIDMTWDIRFRADAALADGTPFHHRSSALGGFNRVLAMLVRVGEEWKLVGWSETPDAAITYMTDLYRRQAADDFKS